MAVPYDIRTERVGQDRFLAPGIIMMGLVIAIAGIVWVLNSDLGRIYPYFYLVPWLVALTVVLATPSLILYHRGKFTFYNPIVLATWSYFFPAFVAGGAMLVLGWSQPSFLSFIQDPSYNLPYTIGLIALGFVGLSLGFFIPAAARLGKLIAQHLPHRDHEPSVLVIPGLCLLFLGIGNSIAALILGIIGFQKSVSIDAFDGVIFLSTLFWMQGTFLLWFIIFRQKRITLATIAVGVLLLVVSLAKALLAGNRGALLGLFMTTALAFLLAGRRLSFKQSIGAGAILSGCLLAGMIYGTTFRNIKGSEEAVRIDQYTENIFDTFDQVGRTDPASTIEFGLASLAERLDTLSSVAVVVSNYEQLLPYEESYGLDNNIWKDMTTFFIPRIIWPGKPVASEPRKYADLYFNYSDNSFAITPIADLLRNFGVPGVFLGMLVLGVLLRIIYRSLVEDQPLLVWRCTLYFMLLLSVSYEGFFGTLIPYLVKVGITAVLGLLITYLIAALMGNHPKPASVS